MDMQINYKTVNKKYRGRGIFGGTGITSIDGIETNADYPLVSFITMIAPSPDWFVGVHDFNLCNATTGKWQDATTSELAPYDAGTDSGTRFESPDKITDPQEDIHRLTNNTEGSFKGNEPVRRFGTFTFVKTYDSALFTKSSVITQQVDHQSAMMNAKSSTAMIYLRGSATLPSSLQHIQPSIREDAGIPTIVIGHKESSTPLPNMQQSQPGASVISIANAIANAIMIDSKETSRPSSKMQQIQPSARANLIANALANSTVIHLRERPTPSLVMQQNASMNTKMTTIVTETKLSYILSLSMQQIQQSYIVNAIANAVMIVPTKNSILSTTMHKIQSSASVSIRSLNTIIDSKDSSTPALLLMHIQSNFSQDGKSSTIITDPGKTSTLFSTMQQKQSKVGVNAISNANAIFINPKQILISPSTLQQMQPTTGENVESYTNSIIIYPNERSKLPLIMSQNTSVNPIGSTILGETKMSSKLRLTSQQIQPSDIVSNAAMIDPSGLTSPPTMRKIQPSASVNSKSSKIMIDHKGSSKPRSIVHHNQLNVRESVKHSTIITDTGETSTPFSTIQQSKQRASVNAIANAIAIPPSTMQKIQPIARENAGSSTITNKENSARALPSTMQQRQPVASKDAIVINSNKTVTPRSNLQRIQSGTSENAERPTVVTGPNESSTPLPNVHQNQPAASIIAIADAITNVIMINQKETTIPPSKMKEVQPSAGAILEANVFDNSTVTDPKERSTPSLIMQQKASMNANRPTVAVETKVSTTSSSSMQQVQPSDMVNAISNNVVIEPIEIFTLPATIDKIHPSASVSIKSSKIMMGMKDRSTPPLTVQHIQPNAGENGQNPVISPSFLQDIQRSTGEHAASFTIMIGPKESSAPLIVSDIGISNTNMINPKRTFISTSTMQEIQPSGNFYSKASPIAIPYALMIDNTLPSIMQQTIIQQFLIDFKASFKPRSTMEIESIRSVEAITNPTASVNSKGSAMKIELNESYITRSTMEQIQPSGSANFIANSVMIKSKKSTTKQVLMKNSPDTEPIFSTQTLNPTGKVTA